MALLQKVKFGELPKVEKKPKKVSACMVIFEKLKSRPGEWAKVEYVESGTGSGSFPKYLNKHPDIKGYVELKSFRDTVKGGSVIWARFVAPDTSENAAQTST